MRDSTDHFAESAMCNEITCKLRSISYATKRTVLLTLRSQAHVTTQGHIMPYRLRSVDFNVTVEQTNSSEGSMQLRMTFTTVIRHLKMIFA